MRCGHKDGRVWRGQAPHHAQAVAERLARGKWVMFQRQAHYIHVLDYVSDCIRSRGARSYVTRATLLKDGSPVRLEWSRQDMTLTIAPSQRDLFNTVVKLEP